MVFQVVFMTDARAEHPEKACSPIDVTLSGSSIDSSEEQLWNAVRPIDER